MVRETLGQFRARRQQYGLIVTEDLAAIEAQLGRPVRDARAVAARCAIGHPLVIETHPRLSDGQPFPTLYYLTCANTIAAIGTLESTGVMSEYERQLSEDENLREAYRESHRDYLRRREAISIVEEIRDISAGGMPDRVKCLHALAAHALAVGPGVNPVGDDVIGRIAPLCQVDLVGRALADQASR